MSVLELVDYPVSTVAHYRVPGAQRPICGTGAAGWVLSLIARFNGPIEVGPRELCQRCSTMARPGSVIRERPGSHAQAGYRWEVAPEAGGDYPGFHAWRIVEAEGRRCRWTSKGRACGAPAVAELNRGRRLKHGGFADQWWPYCGEHLYGRWLEDGVVVHWRLVPDEVTP